MLTGSLTSLPNQTLRDGLHDGAHIVPQKTMLIIDPIAAPGRGQTPLALAIVLMLALVLVLPLHSPSLVPHSALIPKLVVTDIIMTLHLQKSLDV